MQNGLVPALVSDENAAEITAKLDHAPELAVAVDLEQQTIVCGNRSYRFTIDPVRRNRLLEGLDDIAPAPQSVITDCTFAWRRPVPACIRYGLLLHRDV